MIEVVMKLSEEAPLELAVAELDALVMVAVEFWAEATAARVATARAERAPIILKV